MKKRSQMRGDLADRDSTPKVTGTKLDKALAAYQKRIARDIKEIQEKASVPLPKLGERLYK